jgi:hypothetical protein
VQQSVRGSLQVLVRNFQDMTEDQIKAWNDFGSAWPVTDCFGNSIKHTGLNWYVGLNVRLRRAGFSTWSTPPLNPNCDYNPTIDVDQDETSGDIKATFTPAIAAKQAIWVYMAGPLPRSSRFLKKSCRLFDILVQGDTSPVTLVKYADILFPGECLYQVVCVAVDEYGRSTPRLRFTVYPVEVS